MLAAEKSAQPRQPQLQDRNQSGLKLIFWQRAVAPWIQRSSAFLLCTINQLLARDAIGRGQCIMKERPIERVEWMARRLRSATLCRATLRYGGERVSVRGGK